MTAGLTQTALPWGDAPPTAANRLTRPVARCAEGLSAAWAGLVRDFLDSPAGVALCDAVEGRVAQGAEVYPADPLRALRGVAPAAVQVVILGQDPYHGPGEAEGLAFSVPAGVRIPPSLHNIRQELAADLGLALPAGGSLQAWADRGVLLLNTCLTVERDRPASHARLGWEVLTDGVIRRVAEAAPACVFMLWGAHAKSKRVLIEQTGDGRHSVLASNHPSPLSARRPPVPFLGSRPFSAANAFLHQKGLPAMDWRLAS